MTYFCPVCFGWDLDCWSCRDRPNPELDRVIEEAKDEIARAFRPRAEKIRTSGTKRWPRGETG